jgi:hypothetical protein
MIDAFEEEIQLEANKRTIDVLIKLIDLVDKETACSKQTMLDRYVSLKMIRHKIKKALRSNWWWNTDYGELLEARFSDLTYKCKEARRKYYESKRRDEARTG